MMAMKITGTARAVMFSPPLAATVVVAVPVAVGAAVLLLMAFSSFSSGDLVFLRDSTSIGISQRSGRCRNFFEDPISNT